MSIPSTGTHAVAKWLGFRSLSHASKTGSDDRAQVVRHCWHAGGDERRIDWAQLLEGRQAWMPVRDPAELSYSWHKVHGRTSAGLHRALRTASELLREFQITRVDIRELPVSYRRGDGGRDEEQGAILADLYPDYFGGMYDGG